MCVFITAYHNALQRLGDVIVEQLKEGAVFLNDEDELGTAGGHLQVRPLRDHLTTADAVAHHRDAGDLLEVGEVAVEGALRRGENVQRNVVLTFSVAQMSLINSARWLSFLKILL